MLRTGIAMTQYSQNAVPPRIHFARISDHCRVFCPGTKLDTRHNASFRPVVNELVQGGPRFANPARVGYTRPMDSTSRGDQGGVGQERPVVLPFNIVWKGDVQNRRCCQTHDQSMHCVCPIQRFASQQDAAKIARSEIEQTFWDDIDEQVGPLRHLESRRYNQRDSFRGTFGVGSLTKLRRIPSHSLHVSFALELTSICSAMSANRVVTLSMRPAPECV